MCKCQVSPFSFKTQGTLQLLVRHNTCSWFILKVFIRETFNILHEIILVEILFWNVIKINIVKKYTFTPIFFGLWSIFSLKRKVWFFYQCHIKDCNRMSHKIENKRGTQFSFNIYRGSAIVMWDSSQPLPKKPPVI